MTAEEILRLLSGFEDLLGNIELLLVSPQEGVLISAVLLDTVSAFERSALADSMIDIIGRSGLPGLNGPPRLEIRRTGNSVARTLHSLGVVHRIPREIDGIFVASSGRPNQAPLAPVDLHQYFRHPERSDEDASPRDDLLLQLRHRMDQTGCAVPELARRLGISPRAVQEVLAKTRRGLLIETAHRYARALGLHLKITLAPAPTQDLPHPGRKARSSRIPEDLS